MQLVLVLRLGLRSPRALHVDRDKLSIERRLGVSEVRRPRASTQIALLGLADLDHEVERMKLVPAGVQ